MKNKLFYFFIAAISISSLWMILGERLDDTSDGKSTVKQDISTLKIGNKTILLEYAKTEEERTRGLSGRESLSEDVGLLFTFEKPDFYPFWMKDMNFPIDIIWIGDDFRVVDITENLATSTYPRSVTSKKPAKYVLEVIAGFSKKNKVKIGDKVDF